jgi:hypothetical protein
MKGTLEPPWRHRTVNMRCCGATLHHNISCWIKSRAAEYRKLSAEHCVVYRTKHVWSTSDFFVVDGSLVSSKLL